MTTFNLKTGLWSPNFSSSSSSRSSSSSSRSSSSSSSSSSSRSSSSSSSSSAIPQNFPTTNILDDFNRSNQGPPPSSNWVSDGSPDGWKVLSNQATPSVDGYAHDVWERDTFGPDSEV